MASTVKHLRSSTASKRPTASGLAEGQLAINTASGTPGLFLKDSAGTVVKVGPAHVGASAPNAVPAGSAGNSTGELWVDNSTTINGLNYYTGSAFVNLTPSGTTTVAGLVELATDAETQTGSDAVRAVTPSGLQSKLSNSISTTSSTTIASSAAVKTAYDLANAALPKTGGTITGALEIGTAGSLVFEGSSADDFETTLAVVNPTADRTITLPNTTGTVVTTGDSGTVTSAMITNLTIVDGDISASADIVDTKLATIATAGKVSNSATTATNANTASAIVARDASGNFSAGTITANLTGTASNVTTNADLTGDVTSVGNATSIASGVIVNNDVNASAAIAGTKISPNFGSQTVTTTGVFAAASGTASAPAIAATGDLNTGFWFPAADALAASTGGTERLRFSADGAFGLSGANYGTSGQVLTSAGSAAPPTWTTPSGSGGDVSLAANNAFTGANTFTNATGQIFRPAATQDGILLRGRAGGSSSRTVEIVPAALTANRTLTAPDVSGTIVTTGDTGSVTSTMILDGTIVNADINASAAIVDTKLATIATAGKVSNSATTATSANTLSAIVARDGSGNFSAGTITAALTGAASSNVLKAGDTMTGALVHPLGAVGTPSVTFAGDLNTGVFSAGGDQLNIATNGVERVEFGTSEVVFNDGGANYDFRVEGDTITNLFFVDASADAVGIGTSAPAENLHVNSAGDTTVKVSSTFSNSTTTGFQIDTTGDASVGRIDFQKAGATRGVIKFLHNATAASELLSFSFASVADAVVISGAGQLRLATAGITFNGDTAAANELDDYEEGAFTPTIVGSTTPGTGTYSTQSGVYTKIGRTVYFIVRLVWSAHTGAGSMRISGLPFTNGSLLSPVALRQSNLTAPASHIVQPYVIASSSQVAFESFPVAGGASAGLLLDTDADIAVAGYYVA